MPEWIAEARLNNRYSVYYFTFDILLTQQDSPDLERLNCTCPFFAFGHAKDNAGVRVVQAAKHINKNRWGKFLCKSVWPFLSLKVNKLQNDCCKKKWKRVHGDSHFVSHYKQLTDSHSFSSHFEKAPNFIDLICHITVDPLWFLLTRFYKNESYQQ